MILYLAFLAAFVMAMATLPGLIGLLTRRRAEQVISEDVPETHKAKRGTPTLGGIAIVLPTVVVSVAYALSVPGERDVIALTIAFLATSLLGFYDDYLTLARGRKSGQKWSHKLAGQFVIAAGLVVYLWAEHGPALSLILVPGMRHAFALGVWWLPVAAIYLCLMSNAANLSDGLDGLAAGLCLIAAGITGAVAMASAEPGIAVFCLALGGACLGFLWFNCHPAQVFMGNTSSIALGMALGGAALVTRREILLLVPFGVFMAEAFSVVAQVGYYKLTHRRIFLKAPIHHHFEMLGWKETSVVVRFWIVGVLLACVGAILLTL